MNPFNPELKHKDTECGIKNKLIYLLSELRIFKFVPTLALGFKDPKNDDKAIYNTFSLNSKTETIINENETDYLFGSIYSTIISSIEKSLRKASCWIIDPDHNINI